MKIKVIITGVTGMVGEGVLLECLQNEKVESVLVIARKSCEIQHAKLKEIILPDFNNASSIANELKNYDACYFCAGVSSVGMKEEDFRKITYDTTLNFAKAVCTANPAMTFCYVSGVGTDSTEKGRTMWARVKGKTENDLMKLPFKQVFAFRPGFMQPTKGQKFALPMYKYIGWMYKPLSLLFSTYASTLADVGKAMINVTLNGYSSKILEVKDINQAAKTNN